MKAERGSFSVNTPGSATVLLSDATLIPSTILFWVGARSGTTESVGLTSVGMTDKTRHMWMSQIGSSFTKNDTGKPLTHYALVGGVATKVIEANYTSAFAGQFTLNFTTTNVNYPIYFLVLGN